MTTDIAENQQVTDIDITLLQTGNIYQFDEGLIALSGDALKLFRYFEHLFLNLARQYQAQEQHYPVLLPIECLEETGYFSHFPNQVTCCSHFPDDMTTLETISAHANKHSGKVADVIAGKLAKPRHILIPAVCLPAYPHFRDKVFAPGEITTITMQNPVFRYEGKSFSPLSRGWNYTVRDVVFFGPYQMLCQCREQWKAKMYTLCKRLKLLGEIKVAHDPFFLSDSQDKIAYQEIAQAKHELQLSLPHRDKSLSVSSFNLHRDFYSSVYNMQTSRGDYIETACVGFGLERWVYSFLSQHGLDKSNWVDDVAKWCESY